MSSTFFFYSRALSLAPPRLAGVAPHQLRRRLRRHHMRAPLQVLTQRRPPIAQQRLVQEAVRGLLRDGWLLGGEDAVAAVDRGWEKAGVRGPALRKYPSNMPKYRKICPKYGQISLNLSQNFVPICLRVAVDTELRRPDVRAGFGPPAAVCNEFTFNER